MTRAALTRAAGIVASLTVISRLFGFAREASLAAVFGATQSVDAYLMAQAVPFLFLGIVSYALTTTFIPVYSQVRAEKGRQGAYRMANTVIRVVIILGLILTVLGEAAAEPLVKLIAPGFDVLSTNLTVYLSRIIFPMVIFQLVSGIVRGMLQADGQFAVPEVAGLVQNSAVIIATLAFGNRYGITAVAVGLLVGVFGALIIKIPALARTGFRWGGVFDLSDPDLRRMLVLMVPAIIGAGADRVNVLVDRMLASSLPEGRVAALNYAVRLNSLAPAILGTSIVTVIYPSLAGMAAKQKWQRFSNHLVQSLGVIHFLLAPIAVGAIVLREPLVQIVFERGAFDVVATRETAWALLFLAGGMAFTIMQNLMGRAFFALQDTRTPMYIGLVTVGANILANLLLIGPLEQGGLALGTSLAALFGLVLSISIMRRRSPAGLPMGQLVGSMVRVLFAAALMGAAVWLVFPKIQGLIPTSNAFLNIGAVSAGVVFGAVIYGLLAWVMRVPELHLAVDLLRQIWTGRRPAR